MSMFSICTVLLVLYSTFSCYREVFLCLYACLFFLSLRGVDDDVLYQAQRFIEDRNSSNLICMP